MKRGDPRPDLHPTPGEARTFVACVCAAWVLSVFVKTPAEGGSAAAFVAVLGSAVGIYLPPARAVAREYGVPTRALFGFMPRSGRGVLPPRAVVPLVLSLWWWRPAVRATGWPAPLVVLAVVASLVAAFAL